MPETGRYLYAITRGLDAAVLSGVPALGGGDLEVVDHRGLTAVVSEVDLQEFGEDGLARNLEDIDWLEEVARRHDGVVQALARHGATAPVRLATICFGDDGVRRRLDDWYSALVQVLDRVEGRMEWSVKAFAPQRPVEHVPAAPEPVGGAEYLRRKKVEQGARLAHEESAASAAQEVYADLAAASVASRRLSMQDPRLTGHEGTMVLNAAFLVPVGDEAGLATALEAASHRHPEIALDCRGPWPPYSFAMLEHS